MPNHKLSLTKQQEEFSLAWLHAIVAASGYAFEYKRIDDDSIDIRISQKRGTTPKAKKLDLNIQLKCTYSKEPAGRFLKFPLSVKNFNDLCGECVAPRILVVLHVPRTKSEWLSHAPSEMVLKNCAYWTSLHDEKDTTNKSNVTVSIPLSRRMNVEQLEKMMRYLALDRFEEVLR